MPESGIINSLPIRKEAFALRELDLFSPSKAEGGVPLPTKLYLVASGCSLVMAERTDSEARNKASNLGLTTGNLRYNQS